MKSINQLTPYSSAQGAFLYKESKEANLTKVASLLDHNQSFQMIKRVIPKCSKM
jgi:hypothetical protein